MVGCQKLPASPMRSPPCATVAPCFTASCVNSAMAVRRRGLASGPIWVPSAAPSPTFRPCGVLDQRRGEFVLDALVHQEARRRDADLAGVAELGAAGGLDGQRDVGVLGHDHRRVAAQFHRHALHVLAGQRGQLLAHRRRAGEGDLADDRDAGSGSWRSRPGCRTPGPARRAGRPASAKARISAAGRAGVSSAALTIIEQPVASAAADLAHHLVDREVPGRERRHRPHRVLEHHLAHRRG